MKCDEVAEFVSALGDGETIPREAARHIGSCPTCHASLLQYAEIGAELRRLSSLQLVEEEKVPHWQKTQKVRPAWWQKGWDTMRIPRLAFASMLLAIIALASGLTVVRVRAHSQGTVLMLTAETAGGRTMRCALPIEDKDSGLCASVQMDRVPALYGFRIISTNGDRIELGVRAKAGSDAPPSTTDVEQLPETRYWFEPGEKLHVDVQGGGAMVISGELMDHMPPFLTTMGEQLDPDAGELRLVEPVLLRGKDVLHDFEGVTVSGHGKGGGVELYAPHDGRYEVSLWPLRGASEGLVHGSRISFALNGRPYEVLSGAPVARTNRIWVLYLPNDKAANAGEDDRGSAAYVPMKQHLAQTPQD